MTVSIIVPTHNEESTIENLLRNLLAFHEGEIMVVDGSSSDRTAELAESFAGVQVIRTQACRAMQMNQGVRATRGDVLLFLHADVRLGCGALARLRSALADPNVPGGNFDVVYQGGDRAAAFLSRINRRRCRWGIFYGDSGIFCRRAVFEQLGGFRPWPILEDYEFARRLWKLGNVAFLREPIHVSDRRWRRAGLAVTIASWILIQGLYVLGVSPTRLGRLYQVIR